MPATLRSQPKATPSTRDRLIRAGVHFFQTQGYHGTGIAAILSRAKAPKGCFYHHFPEGKEQLAVASLAWLEGEVSRFLDELTARGAGCEQMIEGIARYAAEGIRSGKRRRGSLLAALAQDAALDSPAISTALQQYAGAVRRRLAVARKRERPSVDGAAFADQALAMVQGAGILARVDGNADRTIEIVAGWLQGQRCGEWRERSVD
jgi:TetR/AcrR family transcriptional regulator, lmrAB and yxaGH operons repressor